MKLSFGSCESTDVRWVSDWFVSAQDVSGAFIEKCRERGPGAVRGVARSMSREQPIGTFVVIASHFGQTAS